MAVLTPHLFDPSDGLTPFPRTAFDTDEDLLTVALTFDADIDLPSLAEGNVSHHRGFGDVQRVILAENLRQQHHQPLECIRSPGHISNLSSPAKAAARAGWDRDAR
jgi:hypothetical protein